MSKIKFNKEWYRDNDIVINFKTEEEVNKFINELAKVEITEWSCGDELKLNNRFCSYKFETCYRLEQDYTISYCSINYFKKDYTILKFSDLEFEDGINHLSLEDVGLDKDFLKNILNEDDLGYEELDNSFNKLPDIVSNSIIKKSEPIIETNTPIKRTILMEDVELNNGDIVKSKDEIIGIIVGDCVSWNNGRWHDSLNDLDLEWIIPTEKLSHNYGYEVSQLLFKNELKDNLKDLIIHIQDKPKEIKTRTVEVFSVKFCKTDLGLSHFISDSEEIFLADIISPIRGEYEDLYGEVINIQCKELSEEELKSYNKIIKIK